MNGHNLSPNIIPTKYTRKGEEDSSVIQLVKFGNWTLNRSECKANPQVDILPGDMIRYTNDRGEFFYGHGHAHVHDSMFRAYSLPSLRELVLDGLSELEGYGCVEGVSMVGTLEIDADNGNVA